MDENIAAFNDELPGLIFMHLLTDIQIEWEAADYRHLHLCTRMTT